MDLLTQTNLLLNGEVNLTKYANSLSFARQLDSRDTLKELRNEFIIPTQDSLAKTKLGLDGVVPSDASSKECVYLASHGQGLQPKAVRQYFERPTRDMGFHRCPWALHRRGQFSADAVARHGPSLLTLLDLFPTSSS